MQRICRNKAHYQFHTSRESSIIGHLSIKTRTSDSSLEKRNLSAAHSGETGRRRYFHNFSWSALYKLLKKYSRCHTIADPKRAPRPRILQEEHYRFIDDTMAENMELTARQLYCLFKEKFSTIETSMSTIKRAHLELGWVCKRVKYCQLITEINKEKWVTWCLERVTTNDLEMDDVIFTDESTFKLKPIARWSFVRQEIPSS